MSNPSEAENLLRPDQSVDLTNCEREPIHIPGRIQPHGVLLSLQESDFRIVQASMNAEALLAVAADELLGKSLDALLSAEDVELLKTACLQQRLENNPVHLLTVQISGASTHFDAIVHRSQGVLVLELEPTPDEAVRQDTYALVRQAVPQIQSARTLAQMYTVVAQQVRQINGFDRVMVYQFDADGHGSVVAESKRDDLEAFLGLHYPASDIPAQARRLYTLSLLRLIADIGYMPADVVPTVNPTTNTVLDMSYCVLRSVSPIHVQYLKNMGVAASMSISILQDGELWGLIACHHYTPRFVAYDIRTACEFLGQVVSLQLATKRDAVDSAYQIRLKDMQAQLVALMANEPTYQDGLVRHTPNLLDFIEAHGAVVCTNGNFLPLGTVPEEAFLTSLTAWLAARTDPQAVFATDALATLFPLAETIPEVAGGLLAITVSRQQQHYLLWFRPEMVQTVNWAGDPNKPVEVQEDGSQRLTPRGSFALWKETVRGRSLPWKAVEIEAAQEFRRALVGVILHRAEQLETINAELQRSNAELDAFTYIASHDLREPLRGIRNYVSFLREDYGSVMDAAGQEQLETLLRLTQRMETLIDSLLLYSRVGQQSLVIQPVDLNQLISEVLEVLRPRLQQTPMEVRIPRPLPTVDCDAVQVGAIFSNLLSNALKYNDKGERWVEIGFLDAEEAQRELAKQEERALHLPPHSVPAVFYVRDNGIGIQARHQETIFRIFKRLHAREEFGGGTGAGLTIARKMAQRHGGHLWVSSVYGEGTTFYFTLQKAGHDAH